MSHPSYMHDSIATPQDCKDVINDRDSDVDAAWKILSLAAARKFPEIMRRAAELS